MGRSGPRIRSGRARYPPRPWRADPALLFSRSCSQSGPRSSPIAVGISHMWDTNGRRYIDGSSGPVVTNIATAIVMCSMR